jgi:hypothetical protein
MASPKPSSYTRAQRIEELYRRGVLFWKLHEGQKRMYDAIVASTTKRFVVNSARRLGKSYLLVLLALEHAYRYPNSEIKFAAPNQKMARKIILPLFRQILHDCPRPLRPVFHNHDAEFRFPHNNSTITVCGVEMGQSDGLRGTACDLALLDECGFMNDLPYVIDSILMPQLLTRPNSRMVLASTPPVSPDHPFVQIYMQRAMDDSAYIKLDIYSNPMLTMEVIEEFKRDAGGENSTTWRREYLAEIVTDAANAVFPEAGDEDLMASLIREVPRPSHFIPIVAVDLGYQDFTGILFAYYHFPLGKIVIEDEILINRATSEHIVTLIKAKEQELWGVIKPQVRVVDGPALIIADINETHRLGCRAPDKSDLQANVNRVRMALAESAILFHPRCQNTINQIRYSVWDNKKKQFARTASGGHFDLAAALVYLLKHIDTRTNPLPPGWGWDAFNDFGFSRKHKNTSIEAIKRMFPILARNEK